MATMVPTGNATASATAVVTSVPMIKGRMPNRGDAKSGVQSVSVRKSFSGTWAKKVADSNTRVPTIPTVIATDEKAARNKIPSMIRSFTLDKRRAAAAVVTGGGDEDNDSSAAAATGC